jgi:tetratricopeptide (TPR) repeat protein
MNRPGRSLLPALLFPLLLFVIPVPGLAQRELTHEEARAIDHQSPVWESVRAHLPDPAATSAGKLEDAADLLRARRFLEDAIDYYSFAMERGGDQVHLLNKIGITELELRRLVVARAYFQRAVKIDKKSPEGWNNLGVIDYITGHNDQAVGNYKRAIKLDKKSATYHSNLATALFDKKDFGRARKEYDIALQLDPEMMHHHSALGITTRMLSPADHARFCFELARLYAQRGDEKGMLYYLTKASESGFDIMAAMGSDSIFSPYRKDPRILVIVKNGRELQSREPVTQASATPPPLSPQR